MDLIIPGMLFLLAAATASPSWTFGSPPFLEDEGGSPSCSELRSMWNTMSQSMQMSQVTNEIPILPGQLVDYMYRQNSARNSRPIQQKPVLGWTHRPSIKQMLLSGAGVADKPSHYGHPQDNHPMTYPTDRPHPYEQSEYELFQNGFEPVPSGESKKALYVADDFHLQWGMPEDVGTFGRFVKDGATSHPGTGSWKIPRGDLMGLSEHGQQTICATVLNSACSNQRQCACPGLSSLDCFHGKCTLRHLTSGSADDFGHWHSAPIPRENLGTLSQLRRKKRGRSIFM